MLQNVCPVETYFGSAGFLSFSSHIVSIVSIPINILGILLIYYKTPPRMQKMKGVLLNCHTWGLIGDLSLGTLTIPYVFFPLSAGTPLGILTKFLNVNAFVQTYVTVACIGEVGAAIVFLFENRHSQTVTSSFKLTSQKSRRVFYAINFIVPFTNALVTVFRVPDQDSAKLELLKELPCPTVEYYRLPTIVMCTDTFSTGIFLFIVLVLYTGQFLFFAVHSSIYLFISTKTISVSGKTRKMQQKYFLAVCIQVIIPITVITYPIAYFTFSILTKYYNQTMNNICFLLMSSHGFLGTISTVLIYDNYRSYVLQLLRLKRSCKVGDVQLFE